MENIQRRFTSKIASLRALNAETGFTECVVDYWDRLASLKLYSLERRREHFMILYMFKIHIGAAPDLGFLRECTIRHGTKYHAKYTLPIVIVGGV